MIVILNIPGLVTLPYNKGNGVFYQKFVPGKNEVDQKIWEAVKKYNEKRFENYYNGILKEFKPVDTKAVVEKKEKVEIFINRLSDDEAETIIENTVELSELEAYEKQEKARRQKRKHILKKIEEQKEEIKSFESKIKK